MNADISFIILMYSSKRGDSAYLSLLEQSTHGPLPLDVASAEQHKNRQACDESGQQPTDNTSRDHGKTKGAEKQEGGGRLSNRVRLWVSAEMWLTHLPQLTYP